MFLLFCSWPIVLSLRREKTNTGGAGRRSHQAIQARRSIVCCIQGRWDLPDWFTVSNLLVENDADRLLFGSHGLGMSQALIVSPSWLLAPDTSCHVGGGRPEETFRYCDRECGGSQLHRVSYPWCCRLIHPIDTPDINLADSLFVVGISLLLWFFMKIGTRIRRWQGVIFLVIYLIYFFIKFSAL